MTDYAKQIASQAIRAQMAPKLARVPLLQVKELPKSMEQLLARLERTEDRHK